jgi:hypothetical protein
MLRGNRIFEVEAHGYFRWDWGNSNDGLPKHSVTEHVCLAWPFEVRTVGCTAVSPGDRYRRRLVGQRQSCEVYGIGT